MRGVEGKIKGLASFIAQSSSLRSGRNQLGRSTKAEAAKAGHFTVLLLSIIHFECNFH